MPGLTHLILTYPNIPSGLCGFVLGPNTGIHHPGICTKRSTHPDLPLIWPSVGNEVFVLSGFWGKPPLLENPGDETESELASTGLSVV
jgi:hypothetical protein